RLGNKTVSKDKLLYCASDTAYSPDPIRRIVDELALTVEINFTWSLGFGLVESGRPPIPLYSALVEAQISLIMFEFSSCLFADSAMNLVSDSSKVCLRSGCFSGNDTFRVKDLSSGNTKPIIKQDYFAYQSNTAGDISSRVP
nr:hypothetical protein [Tanacetum cinerariifolium]